MTTHDHSGVQPHSTGSHYPYVVVARSETAASGLTWEIIGPGLDQPLVVSRDAVISTALTLAQELARPGSLRRAVIAALPTHA